MLYFVFGMMLGSILTSLLYLYKLNKTKGKQDK